MSIHPRDSRDATLPFREATKQGTDALKHHVARRFKGAGYKADDILKGMIKTEDFYASEIVQVKVPNFFNGHFVLVGDADYASGPTGAGTSLAFVGAYLLAGEVSRHKDLNAGLKGYEERMRPIINDMQKIPPGILGLFALQTAWGIQLRNMLFTFVSWGMAFSSYFVWTGRFFASFLGTDKYGLPDYDWIA